MHEPTAHELAEQERTAAREQNAARRTERQDLRRLCPVGTYLDLEHLTDLMHQGPSGNRPFLLWRHFAAVGLRAEGFTPSTIAAALDLHGPTLDQVLAPLKPWTVPDDVKRRFPVLYPELVERSEPYVLPRTPDRSNYPFVGTSGWREDAPIEPGIRTRTLAGG